MLRLGLIVALLAGCGRSEDHAAARAMGSAWIEAARAKTCPRPALRSRVEGNGTAMLRRLHDPATPESKCFDELRKHYLEIEACEPSGKCKPRTFEELAARRDLRSTCEPLFASIARVAHTAEACSPHDVDESLDTDVQYVVHLPRAVRIQIAPLVGRGELAAAAGHVLDALRLADDHGHNATTMGAMMSVALIQQLTEMLVELLVDPRLTAGEAGAIARDLDVLLANAPRFDAIMREERAWLANHLDKIAERDEGTAALRDRERLGRAVDCSCTGSLRACAEHLETLGENDRLFAYSVRKLGARDLALTAARMQAELRIVGCAAPGRALAAWLDPDRAILVDGPQPSIAPPAWHQQHSRTWQLACVPATR